MNFKINYGIGAGVFPTSCAEQVRRASLCDMRVLWLICAKGGAVTVEELCAFSEYTESDVMSSVAYWRGAGIIDTDAVPAVQPKAVQSSDNTQKEKKESKPKAVGRAELPQYTSEEIADILEGKKGLAGLIAECNRIMGKMLNNHEINIVIGLSEYLTLDFEYILMLMEYCVSHGKKTLHYVEKTAFGLYDDGITTPDELSAEIQRREAAVSAEGRIRKLFGIGARAFTAKEKREIYSWINDMGYSMDMIEQAYEATVNATNEASLHYAHSIMERWHAEGIKTPEDVERSNSAFELTKGMSKGTKKNTEKKPRENTNSSFDTDEFFEAAIRRSLGSGDKK